MSKLLHGFNPGRANPPFKPEDVIDRLYSTSDDEILKLEDIENDLSYRGESFSPGFFETVRDSTLFDDYKANKKKNFQIVAALPVLTICYVAAATRLSLGKAGGDGTLFFVGFILYFLMSAIFTTYFIAHVIVALTPKMKRCLASYRYSQLYLTNGFGGRIEDTIGLTATILNGIYLLARVYAGQCSDPSNIWASQSCNPVAASNSIPHDAVLLMYALPLLCQCVMRGITAEALAICWISTVFFVLLALFKVHGWLQLWTLIYSIIFMNISYEMERFYRALYVQKKQVIHSAHLHIKHKIHLTEKLREDEEKMKEKETAQLRMLMGNVAHDLKNPLHSIEADLEVLNLFISKIPDTLLQKVSAEFQRKCSGDIFDPRSIFESLKATCKFMGMAINRSQDFMRASNHIALVPSIETFELKAAVSISVDCINQLQTSRPIIVHPIDGGTCSHITSDKHWLSENVLCLLSNAVKFSDSGPVDVKIQIINGTIRKSASVSLFASMFSTKKQGEMSVSRSSDRDVNTANTVSPESFNDDNTPYRDGVEMVLITVEDTGIGITEHSRKMLFQPLKQNLRGPGGAGLGLFSLSKRTEALGGTAGVTSRSDGGQGSMFWFTFPYKPDFTCARVDAFLDSASVIDESETFGPPYLLKPRRVLVVDDSLSILKVTSRLLKINGHTADTATNGAIGLEMLKSAYVTRDFDMVLTDLQMPVMDGMEATVLFRKYEQDILESKENMALSLNKRRKKLLIVGMSANTDDDSRHQALASGMDFFIPKPFAYKDLQMLLCTTE